MPRTVDVDVRRREIVEATARLIAAGGIEAATMRDIAAEAGWTTGVVNHYFADKREVLVRTLEHSLRQRRAARRTAGPPLEQLRAELAAALALDDDARRHWLVTLAFCTQAAGDAELSVVQRDAYRAFRSRIALLVERCRPELDAVVEAEHLIATVDGVALQALFDDRSWPPRRQLAVLDGLVDELAGGASRWRAHGPG